MSPYPDEYQDGASRIHLSCVYPVARATPAALFPCNNACWCGWWTRIHQSKTRAAVDQAPQGIAVKALWWRRCSPRILLHAEEFQPVDLCCNRPYLMALPHAGLSSCRRQAKPLQYYMDRLPALKFSWQPVARREGKPVSNSTKTMEALAQDELKPTT